MLRSETSPAGASPERPVILSADNFGALARVPSRRNLGAGQRRPPSVILSADHSRTGHTIPPRRNLGAGGVALTRASFVILHGLAVKSFS
jgi:hypothetical protein